MNIFRKYKSNDLSPYIKMATKKAKELYGKYGAIVSAINDNTKELKRLIDLLEKQYNKNE